MARKSLSEILRNDSRERIASAWANTEAASDRVPLPKGEYVARIDSGELFTSKSKGTAGYRLAFKVIEGEHAGRRVWHDVWLTEAALAMAKRDLGKLGIVDLQQTEQPLPEGIVCHLSVSLRTDDDGTQFNRVRSFDVLRIEPPEADPFTPPAAPDDDFSEGVTQ